MLICHLDDLNEPASLISITEFRAKHCGIRRYDSSKYEANVANWIRGASRNKEVVFDKNFESGKEGGADEG